MSTFEPFAEIDQLQGQIREAVEKLAETVATIAGMDGVTDDVIHGLIGREADQARTQIKQLRLQERLLLDQTATSLEAVARVDGRPLWSDPTAAGRSTDPRRPDLIREAILVQLVRSNVLAALGEAPPQVLLHRLRRAAKTGDRTTAEAIKEIAIRRAFEAGRPCRAEELPAEIPTGRRYLMVEELGTYYTDYDEELAALLDAVASLEETWLRPDQRRARAFVQAGRHRRKPFDLQVWAGSDELRKAVVERLDESSTGPKSR